MYFARNTARHRFTGFKHKRAPMKASPKYKGGKKMFAIIQTGGKQYKVQEGDEIYIEKLFADAGEIVEFDQVLLVSKEDGLTVGDPIVAGAKVTGKVERHGRGKKILVYKYKSKKNYRRKQGHRQPYSKVVIEKIEA